MPTQFDIEFERNWEGRCPRCGSKDFPASDFIWDESMDDEILCGYVCQDCGYGAATYGNPDALFIEPDELEMMHIIEMMRLYE